MIRLYHVTTYVVMVSWEIVSDEFRKRRGQLCPSQQANLPNLLQALLEQLPDEEKDEALDRAHAAGNLAAARELGGNLPKIATNIKRNPAFS
jgi:hypothetical protein